VNTRSPLLLATHNEGKRSELQALLGNEIDVRSAAELGLASPEETGTTLAENAALKADHGARLTELVTLADDSGLKVSALHGAPGVYSARYAGNAATDADNRALLLERMQAIPSHLRAARFVCALALARPGRTTQVVEGKCCGIIAAEARGRFGFGYDPLFELPDGRTMAELTAEEKRQVSHRADAFRQALPLIRAALLGERD